MKMTWREYVFNTIGAILMEAWWIVAIPIIAILWTVIVIAAGFVLLYLLALAAPAIKPLFF